MNKVTLVSIIFSFVFYVTVVVKLIKNMPVMDFKDGLVTLGLPIVPSALCGLLFYVGLTILRWVII